MIPIHHQRKGYAARVASIRWNVSNGTAAKINEARHVA
jgi:hypothetical protein